MKEYGNDWIITESNSENADIYFYRFFGTKEEVKQKLYEIATDHKKDDGNLLYYPEDKDSIEENMETESLFCMVNFEDYDVVITAKDFRGMDWKR